MKATHFLFGRYKVWTEAENRTALLNLCLTCEICYTDFVYHEDGSISFCIDAINCRRLRKKAEEVGITLQMIEGKGAPLLLWKYRKRFGLLIGALLATALLLLSQCFIWDIRVLGNTTMTESEIREELRLCGLKTGSYIPDLEIGQLENRVLMGSDRISWISINLSGTVATVQVIEHVEPPKEDVKKPANLIASCDGQIEHVELYRGNCVVSRGQAVKKGELLVSGIYDSNTVGYRYTRAGGRVFAKIERSFTVTVPLVFEEKTYSEKKYAQIDLNFFDFSLNIYKRTGNVYGECDIIKEEYGLDLLGLHSLPISWSVTTARPYTLSTVERTYEEAMHCAYAQLSRRLAILSVDAELLEKRIQTTMTDTELILVCTVVCIEDIAVQTEFEITELS